MEEREKNEAKSRAAIRERAKDTMQINGSNKKLLGLCDRGTKTHTNFIKGYHYHSSWPNFSFALCLFLSMELSSRVILLICHDFQYPIEILFLSLSRPLSIFLSFTFDVEAADYRIGVATIAVTFRDRHLFR